MSFQLPPEIAATIVSYAADDIETLKGVALTCQEFCTLAQSHLFSTICLDGKSKSGRVALFKELLKSQPRGAIIAGYIRDLSLLFCDNWFVDDEDDCVQDTDGSKAEERKDVEVSAAEEGDQGQGQNEELPETFCAIEFISEHAKYLRAIHLGPFSDMHMDWNDIPDKVLSALARLLANAQEIVLEGAASIPLALLQNLHAVKSLDISDIILSGDWPRLDASRSVLPAPTSLAIHTGSVGAALCEDQWWDMCGVLSVLQRRRIMDTSHLTTLYLHLLDSPGRNAIIREILSSCASTLQSLRLYIWNEDIYDGGVIDLSHLTSLRSLYLMVNLRNIQDSLLYIARTVDTIAIPETHLAELKLFIDIDDRYQRWLSDMAATISATTQNPESWNTLLNAKLAQIFQASNDTQAAFNLPWPWTVTAYNKVITDFFREALPVIAVGSAAHDRFTIEGLKIRGLIKSFLTLRNEAEFLLAVYGQAPMPLFGDNPIHFGIAEVEAVIMDESV